MMNITQHVNASMPRETPRMREALVLGGTRREWEEIFDRAGSYIWDDAVLRVLESEARREEHRREQERHGIWCAPAPAAASVGRPHIFRALFSKDIGGVTGASDVWADASFVAIDGVSGKVQSLVDYIDNNHLITQATAANQPTAPAADALMSNALTTTFGDLAGDNQALVSNRANALFTYLHSGAGCNVYVAAVNTTGVSGNNIRGWIGTGVQGTNDRYFKIQAQQAGVRAFVGDGTILPWDSFIVGTIANPEATYLECKIDVTKTPKAEFSKKTTSLYSVDPATLASGAPVATLTIGRWAGLSLGSAMRFRSAYLFRHYHNTAERIVVRSRIQADTGQV